MVDIWLLWEIFFVYRRDQIGLDDLLRHQVDFLRGNVDSLPDKFFSEKSVDEIAAHLAKKYAIEPLIVNFGAAGARRSGGTPCAGPARPGTGGYGPG